MADNQFLDSALYYYADLGYPVFPCKPKGKTPLTEHGLLEATTKAETIRQWWTKWPQANIAISTQDLLVIDVDGKDNPWLTGDLYKQQDLAEGPLSLTPRTGRHYIFRQPKGKSWRNSAGKLAPGVDTRANGGYIIVPPSVGVNGKTYRWAETLELTMPPKDLPEPPRWLCEQLDKIAQPTKKAGTGEQNRIQEGQRNSSLASLAGTMRRHGMGENIIEEALLRHNRDKCDPPLLETEVRNIARSISRYPPAAGPPEPEHLTDLGNARRLVGRYKGLIRYCYTSGQWLVWKDNRWNQDDQGGLERLAKETVASIYTEAGQTVQEQARKKLASHAINSESLARLKAMQALAQSEPGVPVGLKELDADPWLQNVQQGTMNLKTGLLEQPKKENLMTMTTSINYMHQAQAPTWAAFLERIMVSNQALIGFLQRAVGYSLTGITNERVMFILHGKGANGKSTFLATLLELFGDYAKTTPADSLLVKYQEGIPNDLARLKAARLVVTSETAEGRRLNEGLIKSITGGTDRIPCRFLHQEWFDYVPQFKIWMASNHKPVVRGTDKAIWDRIRLIPFKVTIPDSEQDKQLPEKLKTELPGIFNWAVNGCLAWQKEGLGTPDEVKDATQEYRDESDIVGHYLLNSTIKSLTGQIQATEIYESYRKWCERNGEKIMSATTFGLKLAERGIQKGHNKKGNFYKGIEFFGDIGTRTVPY